MTHRRVLCGSILGMLCLTASLALGQPKVEQTPIGPDGDAVGGNGSPDGQHTAVLVNKGSRYCVDYDGVMGPKIDAILTGNGTVFNTNANVWMGNLPFLFSDDSAHWVYCYKSGTEYVMMLDGKELMRGPMSQTGFGLLVEFSKGGKHLFWGAPDAQNNQHIYVDGKEGPAGAYFNTLVCSPDGERYAYGGQTPGTRSNWNVVDGRQVNYIGEQLQFTPLNHLISIFSDNGAPVFVMDTKPQFKAASLQILKVSDDGKQIALSLIPQPGAQSVLNINGKNIPGTEGVQVTKVYFSPDGKRYAALCGTGSTQYMLIDGKKGDNYLNILQDIGPTGDVLQLRTWQLGGNQEQASKLAPHLPGFTGDSAKFVYVAVVNGRNFVIVDDQESSGFSGSMQLSPQISPDGKRIAYWGVLPNNQQHVVIDDKDINLGPGMGTGVSQVSTLSFSPDSAHYAFVHGYTVCLDGVPQPGWNQSHAYIFSPDGKHIAYACAVANANAIVVDGKVLATGADANPLRIFFSPDSQHIYWTKHGSIDKSTDVYSLYADAKKVTHYYAAINSGIGYADLYLHFSGGNILDFLAQTDGNARRFTVTPEPGVDLTSLLAAAKAAPAN